MKYEYIFIGPETDARVELEVLVELKSTIKFRDNNYFVVFSDTRSDKIVLICYQTN